MLPMMRKDFPDGNRIFQQDLIYCHTSHNTRNSFEENALDVLKWPGNYPDLKPNENI